MARKSQTKSNSKSASGSSAKKRQVHPKRTGIVWGVFLGAMTLAGGALVLNDGWRGVPAVALAETGAAPRSAQAQPGRWQAIVIHHSASAAGSMDDLQRQAAAWGLPNVGYHFVIGNGNGESDGAIIHGPRWTAQDAGAHVAERAPGLSPDAAWFNEHAIGICLIGNGERRAFTDAQMQQLVKLVNDLQRECGIADSAVFLHSDLVEVASPGRWFPRAQFALQISG